MAHQQPSGALYALAARLPKLAHSVPSEVECQPYGSSGWITSSPWEGLYLVPETTKSGTEADQAAERRVATLLDDSHGNEGFTISPSYGRNSSLPGLKAGEAYDFPVGNAAAPPNYLCWRDETGGAHCGSSAR